MQFITKRQLEFSTSAGDVEKRGQPRLINIHKTNALTPTSIHTWKWIHIHTRLSGIQCMEITIRYGRLTAKLECRALIPFEDLFRPLKYAKLLNLIREMGERANLHGC